MIQRFLMSMQQPCCACFQTNTRNQKKDARASVSFVKGVLVGPLASRYCTVTVSGHSAFIYATPQEHRALQPDPRQRLGSSLVFLSSRSSLFCVALARSTVFLLVLIASPTVYPNESKAAGEVASKRRHTQSTKE